MEELSRHALNRGAWMDVVGWMRYIGVVGWKH